MKYSIGPFCMDIEPVSLIWDASPN